MHSILKSRDCAAFLCCMLLNAFVCFVPDALHAQPSLKKIDSLQQALQRSKEDTNAVVISFQLGRDFWFRRNIPEAVTMLRKSIKLSDKLRFFNYTSDTHLLLANACINLGQYDSVFNLLQSAMYWALRLKEEEHIPKIQLTYSYFYNLLGDHQKALSYGLKAAEGFEKSNLSEINMQSVYAWLEVGNIFKAEQQYDKALSYYKKALAKARLSDKDWYVRPAMINVANIYLKQNNLTEARSLYKEVVKIDRQDNGVDYVISGVSGLGDIAMIKKNYKPAIANFKEALMLGSAHNMKTTIDDYMCRIGYAFFLDKQFDSANIYLNKAYHLAKASQDWKTLADAANYLSALYENEHNYPLALQYQRLYKSASDTIYNKEKVSSLNKLEVLYETARKEKQIVGLQADQAKKQLQLVKQNIWLLITAISLGFIIMAFVLFYRSSKKNRVIAKQRQQLQDKKINSLEQEQKVIALKSMLTGQEAERTRIAKDLHDGLGGLFSTIKMHLSTLQHENEHLKQNELFRKSYKLVDTASEDLRRIAHNMMPEVLMKLGLMHALDDFCNTINEKNSFHVSLLNYGMEKRLNIHTEIMLYRIVQELLNNIIKHAKATEAIVQFNCCKNHIDITVEDNGIGFVPAEIEDKLHAGLDIIKSRANYLNGTVSIDSVQGVGTTVMIAFETDNKTEL